MKLVRLVNIVSHLGGPILANLKIIAVGNFSLVLFVIKEICSWLQTFHPFNQEAAKNIFL